MKTDVLTTSAVNITVVLTLFCLSVYDSRNSSLSLVIRLLMVLFPVFRDLRIPYPKFQSPTHHSLLTTISTSELFLLICVKGEDPGPFLSLPLFVVNSTGVLFVSGISSLSKVNQSINHSLGKSRLQLRSKDTKDVCTFSDPLLVPGTSNVTTRSLPPTPQVPTSRSVLIILIRQPTYTWSSRLTPKKTL